MRLPHPVLLLLAGTAIAACLTWVIPSGQFDRRNDPATGRQVVVAGTFHPVPPAPVTPFAALVAVPRGFVEASDVVGTILFVGGAWVVVERMGALTAVIAALVRRFRRRRLLAIPVVALFFGVMGAIENMQEEIIPLIPVLLVLGAGLGIDAVSVVSMSAGAAMVGSAFGPTNPFQAGIALRLAQEPPLAGATVRLAMLVAGLALWTAATMRRAAKGSAESVAVVQAVEDDPRQARLDMRHAAALAAMVIAMAFYVYGALRLGWGLTHLSAAFLVGGIVAGVVGGMGAQGIATAYLEGMQALVPAAILVGVARSISLVLDDGRIVDSILNGLAAPLAWLPRSAAVLLMVPFHALVHIAIPSISGQAVLTMPLMVPLADLLHASRQAAVLAYETGAGLAELLTPTNGSLMAILLAANVSYGQWLRFAVAAVAIQVLIGIVGILTVLTF